MRKADREKQIDLNMQVSEQKEKFDALIALVGELQALGCTEVLTEAKEDIQFEINQERLRLSRQQKHQQWFYKIDPDAKEQHGPFTFA